MGGLCPLFFDGAVCDFKELPRPDNTTEINKIYKYLNVIRGKEHLNKSFFAFSLKKKHKLII